MLMRLIPVLALFALPVAAETPIAEMVCAPHDDMVARLTTAHRATVVGMGVRGPDAVLEIWQAEDGDWTLVQSYANGQSCILAMGEAWEVPQPPA
jgi:hypothetical protein